MRFTLAPTSPPVSNRSAILEIAFFPVMKCQPDAEAHDSRRRDYEHKDAPADGSLAVLRRRRGRAEAHRAALAERRRDPHRKHQDENGGAKPHFTLKSIIRLASGKKKMVIKIRQRTTEVIVSHFMRDTSYFKCMKYPMMSAALTNDKPSRMVSIFTGCML